MNKFLDDAGQAVDDVFSAFGYVVFAIFLIVTLLIWAPAYLIRKALRK